MLVAEWRGTKWADGVRISLPRDWSVLSVEIFDPRRGTVRPESVVWRSLSAVQVESALMETDCTLLVSFKTGNSVTRSRATVTPIRREEGRIIEAAGLAFERVASTALRNRSAAAGVNRAGSFDGSATVQIDRQLLSDFLPSSRHTVSLWLKTTKTNQVVLSDWSGSSAAPYLLELVVTGDGGIAFYRGEPGRHQSMASGVAIADGHWHNVKVAYDPATVWTRLFVDGVVADSLYGFTPSLATSDFTIGGRKEPVPGDDNVLLAERNTNFVGLLDDVIFRAGELGRDPVLSVDFEEGEGARLPGELETVAVSRSMQPSATGLRARVVGGSVELTWSSDAPARGAYIVERSQDGHSFREAGRLYQQDAFDGTFVWSDPHIEKSVVYYRLRYTSGSGRSALTPIIKLGVADLGAPVETDRPAISVRNFPNPFRESTSIQFTLPDAGHTTVSVWDLAGQPVVTLIDATRDSGSHEVAFSSSELSAGTYFVRVRQGSLIASSKLLVVR